MCVNVLPCLYPSKFSFVDPLCLYRFNAPLTYYSLFFTSICFNQMIIISGMIPLGIASEKGYTEICDLLLTHEADITKGNTKTGNNINVAIHFHIFESSRMSVSLSVC